MDPSRFHDRNVAAGPRQRCPSTANVPYVVPQLIVTAVGRRALSPFDLQLRLLCLQRRLVSVSSHQSDRASHRASHRTSYRVSYTQNILQPFANIKQSVSRLPNPQSISDLHSHFQARLAYSNLRSCSRWRLVVPRCSS